MYARLPVPLQNAVCGFEGWRLQRQRYGGEFEQILASLLKSEWWSESEISEFRDEQVRQLIQHAYENVPYYRSLMMRMKLAPHDIRGQGDLPKLPVTSKEDLRNHMHEFISQTANKRRLIKRHTSGTTGKALEFYSNPKSIAFQWAVWWRHRNRFGLKLSDLHTNFTGKQVVPLRQRKAPFWRWNRPLNQALINMQHVTRSKIRNIVRFLDCHPFKFYSGYPSIIHTLAIYAREEGIKLENSPAVVTTGAETLLVTHRKEIQDFTRATVTDQYGFSEGAGNASECNFGVYHEDTEFGALEYLDPVNLGNGQVRARIICTGFANPDFPLIRYDVGDLAVFRDQPSPCSCGRQSRQLLRIEGRTEDFVITPEGRRIMRFDYVFKGATNVREAQVVQTEPSTILIRIVRRENYSMRDENQIRDEVKNWISPQLNVVFQYVTEIERESSGKFRAVKSLL